MRACSIVLELRFCSHGDSLQGYLHHPTPVMLFYNVLVSSMSSPYHSSPLSSLAEIESDGTLLLTTFIMAIDLFFFFYSCELDQLAIFLGILHIAARQETFISVKTKEHLISPRLQKRCILLREVLSPDPLSIRQRTVSMRKVVSSGRTNTQDLKITEEKVLPL